MSETRIKFTRETTVELDSLPKRCWGRCLRRAGVSMPTIRSGQFVMVETSPPAWVLPAGAVVQLVDNLAEQFVVAGVAEVIADSPTGLGEFACDEPLDREKGAIR
jgi:hypothetical protein